MILYMLHVFTASDAVLLTPFFTRGRVNPKECPRVDPRTWARCRNTVCTGAPALQRLNCYVILHLQNVQYCAKVSGRQRKCLDSPRIGVKL